jgi:DNA-binding HxlR family transcriptional regulator
VRATKTYGHFCTLARALELLGDRWTLLIVRDLLLGRRRFTDLMDRLGGITPATLTQRLRELESNGIVDVDREAGRREVWYALTPAGRDLAPAVEELALWGLRHGRLDRTPTERLHPEHLLSTLRIVLERAPLPHRPARWSFHFTDDGSYTLRFDGERWSLTPFEIDDADVDVVVTTSSEAWFRYLATAPAARPTDPADIELTGARRAIDAFRRALAHFPDRASSSAPTVGRAPVG